MDRVGCLHDSFIELFHGLVQRLFHFQQKRIDRGARGAGHEPHVAVDGGGFGGGEEHPVQAPADDQSHRENQTTECKSDYRPAKFDCDDDDAPEQVVAEPGKAVVQRSAQTQTAMVPGIAECVTQVPG